MKIVLSLIFCSTLSFAQQDPQTLKPADVNPENPEQVIQKTDSKEVSASEAVSSEPVQVDSEKENKVPVVRDTKEKAGIEPEFTPHSNPQSFSVLADVAPLSMWVPYKLGLSLAWQFQPKWSLEVSALRGQIDLNDAGVDGVGDASESRFDVIFRKSFGGSFSIFGGYSYQEVKADVSDEVKNVNVSLPFYDTTLKTHGLIAGLGNRWVWGGGFTFGVDWLSIIIPLSNSVENDLRDVALLNYADPQDKQDITDAMDKIEKTPRLTLLHMKLGWTF